MNNRLETLNERIADRIGRDLVELIPEDEWQQLVNKEIRKFKLDIAPKIIQEMLKETYKNEAKAAIQELTLTDEWSEITGNMTSSKLKEFISEGGGMIFAGVLSPAMSMVLQDLNNKLNSGY